MITKITEIEDKGREEFKRDASLAMEKIEKRSLINQDATQYMETISLVRINGRIAKVKLVVDMLD